MIKHKVTPFLTVLTFSFTITKLAAQQPGESWNVVQENGKQYIPVSDVEKFYQFKGGFYTQKPPSYRMFHTNLELGFQFQDDELIFNKVPIASFEPMVKKSKSLLVSVQDLSSIINPVLNPQRIRCRRISQVALSFGGGESQPEPAFFNDQIQKAAFIRVDAIDRSLGGIAIQINRQALADNKKHGGIIWSYQSDPKLLPLNHRNVALATSVSAYFKAFKNMQVNKVTAQKQTGESNSDLIINLGVHAADEEVVWKAILQSLQKFNSSLGR